MTPRLFSASLLLGLIPATAALAAALILTWSGFLKFLSPALAHAATGAASPTPAWTPLSLIPALAVAGGGWAAALYLHLWPVHLSARWSDRAKTLYVFFWNKGYFDELYEVFVVRPTLRFAAWLWRVVDLGLIDRVYETLARGSLVMARWLWVFVDTQGIDRAVTGVGQVSIRTAQWLWQIVDIKGIDRVFGGVGRQSDQAGHALRKLEPRMLQHHLLVMILWLVVGISLFFWLIL